MKPYPKYKNSGVEWLGEVPETWDVKKIKYLANLQSGYAFKSDTFTEVGIPIVRIGDINPIIDWDQCKRIPDHIEIAEEFQIRKNDTLIALSGATTGKTTFIEDDPEYSYINQRVAKVSFENKLLYYVLASDIVQKLITLTAGGSAQDNISNTQIENIDIALSEDPSEQTAIANYLDRKTAEIDGLIAGKERLIELYEEEKTAVINQAVTKGLDPDTPMKPSGIDWLGDIPAHWEVKRLKYLKRAERPQPNIPNEMSRFFCIMKNHHKFQKIQKRATHEKTYRKVFRSGQEFTQRI